jgi:U3 small nucleolar ribonucleoprotein protein IMP4
LIIVHETRGQPDGLIVSHFPHGPTAYFTLSNVVLRHDIEDKGTVSEAFPHLIFNNMSSKLGERTKNILKYLFPVPKEDSKRVMTFANDKDYISFRHHVFHTVGKEVHLAEVGPRFEMKLYRVQLGTVDMSEADDEWVLRPYMRTAKTREFLNE